jgi:hypothetical protein
MQCAHYRRVHFKADVATLSNLRSVLCLGCEMLHFTGHGQAQSQALAFEHDNTHCGVAHCIEVSLLRPYLHSCFFKRLNSEVCDVLVLLQVAALKGLFKAGKVKTKVTSN